MKYLYKHTFPGVTGHVVFEGAEKVEEPQLARCELSRITRLGPAAGEVATKILDGFVSGGLLGESEVCVPAVSAPCLPLPSDAALLVRARRAELDKAGGPSLAPVLEPGPSADVPLPNLEYFKYEKAVTGKNSFFRLSLVYICIL